MVQRLLSGLPRHGQFDLVECFTAQLPINVIAELLGLPVERWAWLRRLSQSTGSLIEVLAPPDPAVVNRDVAELHVFIASVVAERRCDPRDDLVSALVARDPSLSGASLARMQLRIALPPLLERLDGATIDVAGVEWKRSATLRGPTRIPVRLQ